MSRRTAELGTENSFSVLAEVNRRLSEGQSIVSFCIGEPDYVTPASVRIAGIKAIADGRTGYTPAAGLPRLQELVAEYFSRTRDVPYIGEDVVIGCGSKPFIGYTILSVTDAGLDHDVLYPSPGYPGWLWRDLEVARCFA
jgi:aspartate aminotransferase